MVGIYGANMKIAIVMVMFTQAFRYAYEPFIFAQAKGDGEDKSRAYCDAMKYFVIFGLLIFLGVMYFLPILKHFIAPGYWSGLRVVPIMMMAEPMFRSVLQSVAMVQTHRQDPVGDVFLLDMLRAHVRTQRMACA